MARSRLRPASQRQLARSGKRWTWDGRGHRGSAEARAVAGAGLAGTAANASIAAGDFAAITENASVVRLDNLSKLSSRASRHGIAGLTAMQVLALVLVWLLAVGVPVIQQALPPEAQALLSDENGTISLAFAITLVILSRRP